MPSLRQTSTMLSSPRSPSSTIRILSSAEKCRRVARQISFTTRHWASPSRPRVLVSSSFLRHYDEAKTLL